MQINLKDYTKNWELTFNKEKPQWEAEKVMLSCLLRIAESNEAMAKNHIALQRDAESYKRWYNEQKEAKHASWRRNSALRGHITRLKNERDRLKSRIAELEQQRATTNEEA